MRKLKSGIFFAVAIFLFFVSCASTAQKTVDKENVSFSYERENHFTVEALGNKLACVLYMPESFQEGDKIPLMITMHGMKENRDAPIEKAVSDAMVESGYAVIRFDFAAHGESEGKDYEITTQRQVEEGMAVYDYAVKLPFVSYIALFGHSQGGLVAGLLAAKLGAEKIPVLVQVAASASVKDVALTGMLGNKRIFNPDNIPDRIPLANTGFTLGGVYYESLKDMPIYEQAETYSGKVLLLHGEEDTTVSPETSSRYAEAYKAHADCRLVFVPGEPHQFVNDRAGLASRVVSFVCDCTNEIKQDR
jgi:hypothetical protein